MKDIPRALLKDDFHYAVVGATPDRMKYGNMVLRDLQNNGYEVVGINPKHETVEGVPTYPRLQDMPTKPDVAVFVVPPEVGLKLLDDVKASGIKNVWFQPGAESDAITEKTHELGFTAVTDGSCIMVEHRALKREKREAT